MKKIFATLTLVFFSVLCVKAQDFSLYEKYRFIQNADTLPYRILLPENFNPKKRYPLVLFLHGSGERGSDNERQLMHGGTLFLEPANRKKFPAIVVFPQCTKDSYWSNVQMVADSTGKRDFYFVYGGQPSTSMRLLMQLVNNLEKQFRVSKQQMYVMGLSMGGMGTFEIVHRMPDTFAAAVPICGGANTSTASGMKFTRWWVFHGAKDDVVPPHLSEEMVKALRRSGAQVKYTLYPDANHNSWDSAFAEPDLLKWMFNQKRYFSREMQSGDR